MSVRPLRLFVIGIGLLGASLAALSTVVAPNPASADSFACEFSQASRSGHWA